MKFDPELINVVRVTGELYNKTVSEAGATMFLLDLARFDKQSIMTALQKCRQELKFFPTVAEVIARIPDGRPGVEEAWSMIPKDEYGSVVWTDEMCEAFGVARALIEEDPIAARMAFKESYTKICADAKASGKPVRWSPSLGFDKGGRAAALQEAVQKGRISLEFAQNRMPEIDFKPGAAPQLENKSKIHGLLSQAMVGKDL